LLPTNVLSPIHYLYLGNRSALWRGNSTNYPWTDKEFIGAAVVNSGQAAADNIHVRCYVDGQSVATDTVIPHLDPGDAALVDRMWMLGGPCNENRLVKVMVDPDNAIQESDETNNADSEVVSVFYAQQNQSPNRFYDLRTDTYGQFTNFGWNLNDLWLAFSTDLLSPPFWSIPELAELKFLYVGYMLASTYGGHCYGMAATPIHYFDRAVALPPPYQTTYDLPLDVAQPNINRYHVTQFFDAEYIKWCYDLTSPNAEYSTLRHCLKDLQEPVMLHVDDHSVTCYKMVERGDKGLAYFYNSNDDMCPGQTIAANLVVFDLQANTASHFAYETPFYSDYMFFTGNPYGYPYGFPYWLGEATTQKVLVRRPILLIDDWARPLLELIWSRIGGDLISRGTTMVTIACPDRGLITDNCGRRIGFVGDSLVNEIGGASVDTGGTVEVYHLPDSLTYAVSTAAYDTGSMSIRFVLPVAESVVRLVNFDTIRMLATTKTSLALARADTGFRLQVDWDGNGVTDTILFPNFNDTISLRQPQGVTEEVASHLGHQLSLGDASPNPFSGATQISYALAVAARVSLVIHDIAGRAVRTLIDEQRKAGTYSVNWNGTDDKGRRVSPGVYFYSLRADDKVRQKKMVVLE
jgi:hypothetical protein